MTTAPDHLTLATPAVDDVTCLLPAREALLDELAVIRYREPLL